MAAYEDCVSFACNKLGYEKLEDFQRDGVFAVLQDQDVFVAAPTGSGKSLIFQLIPFAMEEKQKQERPKKTEVDENHFVLIVSPLISLMRDQVRRLKEKEICCLSLSDPDVTPKQVMTGNYRFLFGSPESILSSKFRSVLKSPEFQRRLSCVVIDESHCIVKWGTQSQNMRRFRHMYGQLAELRSLWMVDHIIPYVAMTATATKTTTATIIRNLELRNPVQIIQSPHRANIHYSVIRMEHDNIEEIFKPLIEDLKANRYNTERTIIFCQRLNMARSLYRLFDRHLREHFQDIKPYEKYQGNTEDAAKEYISKSFADDKGSVRVLVATIAFGMGVDCKGLRLVIHFGPPTDIDNYCQETGRAGRDGAQSYAVLIMYPRSVNSKRVSAEMKDYCSNTAKCRQELLYQHFSGRYTKVLPMHNCCDICCKKCDCSLNNKVCSREHAVLSSFEKLIHKESSMQPCAADAILSNTAETELREKLRQFRLKITSSTSEMYTGSEITSGFPRKAVDEIVSNCMKMKEPKDVMRFSSILSSDLCTPLFEIVSDSVNRDSFVNINIPGLSLPEHEEVTAELPNSDFSSEASESETSEDSCDSDNFINLQNRYRSRLPSSSSDDSA